MEKQITHYVGDDCPGGHRREHLLAFKDETCGECARRARDGGCWERLGEMIEDDTPACPEFRPKGER